MTYFATFDAEGLPLGFYVDVIHGARLRPVYGPTPEPTEDDPDPVAPIIGQEPDPDCKIPIDAVEITDEQWLEMVENSGARRWDGAAVIVYEPPPPPATAANVDQERDRRFALGAVITLGDSRTFAVDIDDTARINITGLMLAMQGGPADATADFRGHDNITYGLAPADVVSMAQQAMARVSAIYQASWTLKALDPIPFDYADDGHWPA